MARHSTFHRRMLDSGISLWYSCLLAHRRLLAHFLQELLCPRIRLQRRSSRAKSTEQNWHDKASPDSPSTKDGHQAVSHTNAPPMPAKNVRGSLTKEPGKGVAPAPDDANGFPPRSLGVASDNSRV
jgi:hypothetical protein